MWKQHRSNFIAIFGSNLQSDAVDESTGGNQGSSSGADKDRSGPRADPVESSRMLDPVADLLDAYGYGKDTDFVRVREKFTSPPQSSYIPINNKEYLEYYESCPVVDDANEFLTPITDEIIEKGRLIAGFVGQVALLVRPSPLGVALQFYRTIKMGIEAAKILNCRNEQYFTGKPIVQDPYERLEVTEAHPARRSFYEPAAQKNEVHFFQKFYD